MIIKILYSLLFFVVSIHILTGCSVSRTKTSMPVQDESFLMSPSELESTFSSIKQYHPDYRELKAESLTYNYVEKSWGSPIKHKREWIDYGAIYAYSLGIAYTAMQGFDPLLSGVLVGSSILTTPIPLETFTWEKGNYRVKATFGSTLFRKEKELSYWLWEYKSPSENDSDYRDWLTSEEKNRLFIKVGYSTGGDTIAESKNGKIKLGIGHTTLLGLGYKFVFPKYEANIKISSGIEYSGVLIPTEGAYLTQFPVEVVFGRKLSRSFNYGIGVGYLINPVLNDAYESGGNVKFDNTFNYILQVEHLNTSTFGFGFRYEFIQYKTERNENFNGNNLSVFLLWYL